MHFNGGLGKDGKKRNFIMSWSGKISHLFSSKNSQISQPGAIARRWPQRCHQTASTWGTTESTLAGSYCLCMPLKTCALLSLLWMKINIKNLKEPVQTGAFLPANKLCPLLSTQWYIHIQEHSAGVHDVPGLHLPTLSERVAEGSWRKARKGRGFGNSIQS